VKNANRRHRRRRAMDRNLEAVLDEMGDD
jgi:hypothetical protein